MAKIAAIFQLLDKKVTVSSHRLELLSPARDAAIAREAILHGADAVYIGGPGFGARHNASNSLKDIAELVPFAHRYGAKMQANGTIQAVQYQGAATRFELTLSGGEKLLVSQANMTGEELPATLTPGQQVMVSWSRDVMVALVEER